MKFLNNIIIMQYYSDCNIAIISFLVFLINGLKCAFLSFIPKMTSSLIYDVDGAFRVQVLPLSPFCSFFAEL